MRTYRHATLLCLNLNNPFHWYHHWLTSTTCLAKLLSNTVLRGFCTWLKMLTLWNWHSASAKTSGVQRKAPTWTQIHPSLWTLAVNISLTLADCWRHCGRRLNKARSVMLRLELDQALETMSSYLSKQCLQKCRKPKIHIGIDLWAPESWMRTEETFLPREVTGFGLPL